MAAKDPFTAPVTLHLTTIDGISAGLAAYGLLWKPRPFDIDNPPQTNGLYAWATDNRAVIYLGVGINANGAGLATRIKTEIGWANAQNVHGHALAVTGLGRRGITVQPYAGEVTVDPAFEPTSIGNEDWADIVHVRDALIAMGESPIKGAEKLAVRLSMHLGDIGVPVNSQFKSAWGTKAGQLPLWSGRGRRDGPGTPARHPGGWLKPKQGQLDLVSPHLARTVQPYGYLLRQLSISEQ